MEVKLTDLDKLEVDKDVVSPTTPTPQDDHDHPPEINTAMTTSTLVSPDISHDHEDSEISEAFDHAAFKWMTRITYLMLRIKFDAFLDFPKVSLDLALSSGRHLCIDNVRQCSDDTIAEDLVHKTRTVMVRTYKGRDLLKIKCTHDLKIFSIMEPVSDKPVSILTVSHSHMEVHNLVDDEWYFVDLTNRRSQLILIKLEDGTELGRITGFGNFEPQSSSSGNVMILRPKLTFTPTMGLDGGISIDNSQKAILLSIFIALGLTFDGDVKKTTDAFHLLVTLLVVVLIICAYAMYKNSDLLKEHGNVIFVIYAAILFLLLGLLYLIRCCLR